MEPTSRPTESPAPGSSSSSRGLDLLAIGAHPDDVEISCGGTLALAARSGCATAILDLTRGELGTNGTPEGRAREAAEAARLLGVPLRRNADLPDGGLDANDPAQERALVEMIRVLRPRVVLSHFPRDRHPDHVEASRLVDRAIYLGGLRRHAAAGDPFRPVARYHFASRVGFEPSLVVDITAVMEVKRTAILAHASQVSRSDAARATALNEPDFLERLEARARYYGSMIGVRYGEPFASTEPLGIRSIESWIGAPRPAPGSFTG